MKNREEVIKEFLNDKEKLKAISEDEEFISKVSKGKATPETYKEEFKKIGLELTDEEAVQTAETINKIQNTPEEKLPKVLNDLSLENISGGDVYDENDNIAITDAMFRDKYGFDKSDILPTVGTVGACAAASIAVAGVLAGAVCGACKLATMRAKAIRIIVKNRGKN